MKLWFLVFLTLAPVCTIAEINTLDDLYKISAKQQSVIKDFIAKEPNKTIKTIWKTDWLSAPQKFLFLNELQELDKETALLLSNWQGKYLFLCGLKKLSPDIMEILSQWSGHCLFLDGLLSLEKGTAEHFEFWKGYYLSLNGLVSISANDAEYIRRCAFLYLNSLENISVEIAKNICHKNVEISLNGLKSFPIQSMYFLTKNQPRVLYLSSMTKIPGYFFDEIQEWSGALYLDGIIELTEEDIIDIAKWQGKVLHLNNVQKISIQTCKKLVKWQGKVLHLNKLNHLDSEYYHILSTWTGHILSLNQLGNIEKKSMQFLSSWKGYEIFLSGIKELSKESLESLTLWTGNRLHLCNLHLDEEKAKIISRWQGNYLLLAKKELFSKSVQEILKTNPAIEFSE